MKWIGNILLAFILLSCLNLSAQQTNSVEVEKVTLKFIAAFKHLIGIILKIVFQRMQLFSSPKRMPKE